MKEKIHIVDHLKTLDNVLLVDPRNKPRELGEWHFLIADILLNDSTPTEVNQIFENAKNIALYSYFAYRLHQTAELIGFIALEKALIARYELEKLELKGKKPTRLQDYVNLAINLGWIKDEGYESFKALAISRLEQDRIIKMISEGRDGDESVPIPSITDDDVIVQMRQMNIAKKRLHSDRKIRNFLAHGDGGLAPTAVDTLSGTPSVSLVVQLAI